METVLSDICYWCLGIVELNVPEQGSRDLVVEFLQFREKNREIIIFISLYRSKAFFSEILQGLSRHRSIYSPRISVESYGKFS